MEKYVKQICKMSQRNIPRSIQRNSIKNYNFQRNHNYNKIVKSDWLSTALISALIGQFDRTVRVMPK